jgi:tetratricopeptide (TPR) repeat protein
VNDTYRPLPTVAVLALVLVLAMGRAQPGKPSALTDPEDERAAAFRKAAEQERLQQYAAAAQLLQVLPRSASDYLLDLRLGWLHYLAGNHASAIWYYEHAQVGTPRAIEPRVALLLPLLAQQRYAEVEQHARIVLAVVPDHYLTSLRLAFAYRMQGKHDQAAALNVRMLELYPSDADFLLEQALTRTAQGRPDEARRLYRDILLLVPDHALATQGLAALAK